MGSLWRRIRRIAAIRVLGTLGALALVTSASLSVLGVPVAFLVAAAREGELPWVWTVVGCSALAQAWNVGFLLWLMLRAGGWVASALLGVEPVRDPEVLARLEKIFVGEAGLARAPRAYWLRSRGRRGSVNALLLCDRLLLSRALARRPDPEEFRAVLLHEAAHARLGHMAERAAFAVLTVGVFFFPWEGLLRWAGWSFPPLVLAFGLYLLAAAGMRRLIRRHEFEADAFAVARLADPMSLGRALEFVTRWNRQDPARPARNAWLSPMAGHPTCVERLARIRKGEAPASVRFRWNPAWAVLVLALASAALTPFIARWGVGPSLAVEAALRGDQARLARLRSEGVDMERRDWLRSGLTPQEALDRGRAPASHDGDSP